MYNIMSKRVCVHRVMKLTVGMERDEGQIFKTEVREGGKEIEAEGTALSARA